MKLEKSIPNRSSCMEAETGKALALAHVFFLDRSLTSTHSSPDHGPAGALLTNFNFGTLLGLITHSGSRRIALEGNLEACCIGQ